MKRNEADVSDVILKPCPFDGGMPHLQTEDGEAKFFVICLNCHCAVGERYDPDGMPDHEFSNCC